MTNAQLTINNVKYLICTALFTTACFIPQQVLAQPLWYAGGSLGYTDYDNGTLEADLAERQVPGSSSLRDDKLPWHVFAGYRHNRYLALELGYQYLDRQAGTTVLQSQPTISADTSRETDGFMFGINGILPFNNKFTAQIMGGIYLWHVVTAVNSLSGGGAIAINFDERTSESFAGIGIQYSLTGNTAFHIRYLDLNIDNDHANVLNFGITHQFLVMSE